MIPLNNNYLMAESSALEKGWLESIALTSQPAPLKYDAVAAVRKRVLQQFALCVFCMAVSGCVLQRYDDRPISAEGIAADLASRSLSSPELRDFVRSHSRHDVDVRPGTRWDLDALTLVAFFYNPDLDAARARLATMEAGRVTAAQRPNPILQVPFQRTLNPKQGESPWTFGFALDIPIETAGKRGYLISEAEHLETASRLHVADAVWNVRSQLRGQLLLRWAASEKLRLSQAQLSLDQRLLSMFEMRLSQGYASTGEVNRQRLSVVQSTSELSAMQREAATTNVSIARILGLKLSALSTIELDLSSFSHAAPELPSDELRNLALLNRVDIRATLAQYEATQAALQLAVAKQYPDIHLGPGYTLDQGARKVEFAFTGLELPIFNRNEGPIAAARGRRREAEALVRQVEAKALSDTDSAFAAYQTARTTVSQNHAQLAVQQHQVEAARRALQLGEEDRMALVLAQKAELVAELSLLNAVTAMQQAVGKVEDAMQRPISTRISLQSWSGITK